MAGTRWGLVAAFVVLMAFGWWVTAQPPFSTSGTIGVLVAGVALIVLARASRRTDPADTEVSGQWVWIAIVAGLVVWELVTFVEHPREAHPTISSITDPLQAEHVVRWLLFGGWLGFGWLLAT